MTLSSEQLAASVAAQTGLALTGAEAAAMARRLAAQLASARRFLALHRAAPGAEPGGADFAATLVRLAADDR